MDNFCGPLSFCTTGFDCKYNETYDIIFKLGKIGLRPPGTSVFAEFLKTPCYYTEQSEIIVNKISTVSQCTRDVTGHLQLLQLKVLKGTTKLKSGSEFFGGRSVSCKVRDKKNLRKLY